RAERVDNMHTWGKIAQKDNGATSRSQLLPWGFTPRAAGTSQTCSKCKRWSRLGIGDEKNYELQECKDGLFKTRIADGEVRLLKKEGAGDKVKGKDLKGMIYKAMRPNMTEKLDGSIKLGLGMHIAQREKT